MFYPILCLTLYFYFYFCYDKIPDKSNLRNKRVVLAYSSEGYSPSQQGRYGGRNKGQLILAFPRSEREIDEQQCSAYFLSFTQTLVLSNGRVPVMVKVDLTISHPLILENPNRHVHRLISLVLLDTIKLTININHHKCLVIVMSK